MPPTTPRRRISWAVPVLALAALVPMVATGAAEAPWQSAAAWAGIGAAALALAARGLAALARPARAPRHPSAAAAPARGDWPATPLLGPLHHRAAYITRDEVDRVRGLADVAPHAQADALDAVLRDLRRRLGADSTRMPVALGVPITGDEVTTVYEAARWAERLAARDAAPAVRLAETLYERLGAGREAVTTDDGVLVWHRPDESVPVETETE